MTALPILSVPPKLSFDRPVKNSTHIAWAWDPTQGPRRFDHERSEEGPWQVDGATGLNEPSRHAKCLSQTKKYLGLTWILALRPVGKHGNGRLAVFEGWAISQVPCQVT